MSAVNIPSWDILLTMKPPRKWSINTNVDDTYVRVYQDFVTLYEYRFQDAKEAEAKMWELWRKWYIPKDLR